MLKCDMVLKSGVCRCYSGMCSSSPGRYTSSLESTRLDDEHRLIARYAARLAAEARTVVSENTTQGHLKSMSDLF